VVSPKYRSSSFGSATALLADPFREVYVTLMDEAKANGQYISFDPNYRDT
jgi:fructokinase